MEEYSDLDTSSESEYDFDQGSTHSSDHDEDELTENLEPELSETTTFDDEYRNAPWNPQAQLQARFNTTRLRQLHVDIKARAQLPDPTYQKLPRSWPARPFDVRILPDYVQHPIHYFELFWDPEIWNMLVENTNAYAQYKEARHKENKEGKSRW
jgi:Transposase IS4